ncbi:integral membrane protein [Tothia fuscella]|uniref:Integral membrane protein n=1 Tax=Tothia fuscella TaxID=1048955 RepID=A0A9P4TX04_9PEZI|nr:integral membrane protein [Tothia fuscella]
MMSSKMPAQKLSRRHPMQRLNAPERGLSALLHAASLMSFAYNFRYLYITPNPVNESYGWHFQFLTIIGLSLATLTSTTGLLSDLTLSSALFTAKNTLSITAAPINILISILYWSLRLVDPALVIPEWAPRLPQAIDWGFHVIPACALTLDLLLFSPPWTITWIPAVGVSSFIAFGYWFWIEKCFGVNGFYPYPIFELLSLKGRVGLFATSAALMAGVTTGLRSLYEVVNGKAVVAKKRT